MRVKQLQGWIALGLIGLVMAGCSGLAGEPSIIATMPPARSTTPPQPVSAPDTAPDLALGAQVYAENCTRCHGTSGKGDGEMVQTGQVTGVVDFTDPQTAQGATPQQWYEIVTNGRLDKLMPPWVDKLSDMERWSVTNYVYTLANPGSAPVEIAAAPTAASASAPAAPDSTAESNVPPPNGTAEVASAATPGSVSGTVINKTANGSVPPDLTINLHVFSIQDTQDPGSIQNATVNADGSFRFENVPISADSEYIVTATYQEAVFSSDPVQGDPANPQIDLPLSLYDVTNDPANIQIDGMLMMLQTDAQAGQLQVVQIVSFNNTSDRVYLKPGSSDNPTSVSVHLPSGAVFQDFSSGAYALSADGTQVSDTQAVLPGSSHVMHVAYNLPYSGSASIVQPLDYPFSGQVEIMAQNGGMTISGDNFAALGTRQLGDRTFTSYGGVLTQAAGDALHYGVSGSDPAAATTSSTTTTTSTMNPLAYVLIAAGLLAIGAAFGFFLRERTSVPGATSLNATQLMKQIADLDVQYHNGKMPEARYRQQRSTLKAQLVILMKDQAEATPNMDQ